MTGARFPGEPPAETGLEPRRARLKDAADEGERDEGDDDEDDEPEGARFGDEDAPCSVDCSGGCPGNWDSASAADGTETRSGVDDCAVVAPSVD